MQKPIIYRQNRLFKINEELLPPSARTLETINDLYIAIFREFQGAEDKDKYKKLNYQERMNSLNEFAKSWLIKKGYKPYGSNG